MRTARKVADRVVMVYPTARLDADESQIIFDGPPSELRSNQGPACATIRARRGGRTTDGDAASCHGACAAIEIMDERQLKFRVGVVVLAAAVITVILITLLGAWPTLFQEHMTIEVAYSEAPGVTVDTPVRMSGIQVGRVSDLKLQEDGTVLVDMKIDQRYKIPTNRICRIGTGSLITGDAIIEWVPTKSQTNIPPNIKFYSDQDHFDLTELPQESLQPDPLQLFVNFEDQIGTTLVAIGDAGQTVKEAGGEVKLLAQEFNRVMGSKVPESQETQVEAILNEARIALRNMNVVLEDIQQLSGDQELQERLKQTLNRLPTLAENAESTLTDRAKRCGNSAVWRCGPNATWPTSKNSPRRWPNGVKHCRRTWPTRSAILAICWTICRSSASR